jgi:precorrin-2 methylase
MSASPPLPYDIAVVGLGITSVHHITREAEETLRRCRRTFLADTTGGVASYLTGICPEVVDLSRHFKPGRHRAANYQAIAGEVVAAALDDGPICFATYGHPKMLSYPTVLIQRAATILDLRLRVLPGISFLDTLLADLGVDPGFDGLQLYEATDLLVRRRPLQTDVGCVIAQVSVVANPVEGVASDAAEQLARLQEYLLGYYPPEHGAVVVTSRTHPLLEPLLYRARIGNLVNALSQASHSGTLYIPPVSRRPIADRHLADRMRRSQDG